MKVIQLCKSVYPYSVGGVEVYVHNLTKQLEKRGHQVHLIVTKNNVGKHCPDEISSGTNVRSILRILDEKHYDCLHIHSFASLGILELGIVLLFNKLRKKKPVIITPHGSFNSVLYNYYGFSVRFLLQRAYVFYLKNLSTLVDCYIVFTQHQQDLWRRLGFPAEKIVLLPPFVDLGKEIAGELSVNQNDKSVLYVGRLSKEKGIEFLLRAIAIVHKASDVKLRIVGDGKTRKGLVDLTRELGIESEVTFEGNIPHEKLAEIYSKSSIFVLPSICAEGFPLVILEAMKHGLPVITTNVGGQAELVRQGFNGELVNPSESKRLAEKISFLLSHPELRKVLGQNAKTFVGNFGAKEHVEKLETIYSRQMCIAPIICSHGCD